MKNQRYKQISLPDTNHIVINYDKTNPEALIWCHKLEYDKYKEFSHELERRLARMWFSISDESDKLLQTIDTRRSKPVLTRTGGEIKNHALNI